MKRISPWKIDNRKSTHSAKKNLIMIPSCTKRSQNASVLIAFRYFLNIFSREISRKEQYSTFLYVTSQFHERSIIYIALFLFLTMNVGSIFWISQAFIGHGCGHLCDTIGLNVLVMWHGRNGKKRRLSSLPLLVFFSSSLIGVMRRKIAPQNRFFPFIDYHGVGAIGGSVWVCPC